ncbi:hypothetical protein [Streptomyces sp. SID685]|uniref:hypothetical protein n=1 Tax=Streptomyces sp. SID685 TaxID=2690322 RepID=UPI0019268A25|nr:hypothetical protein [Streptomyces sp. SID685]
MHPRATIGDLHDLGVAERRDVARRSQLGFYKKHMGGNVTIDVVDAVVLVRKNRKTRKRLQKAAQELDQQVAEDFIALDNARQMLYDVAVLPFRDVYGRVKNVDHFELAAIERPTASTKTVSYMVSLRSRL